MLNDVFSEFFPRFAEFLLMMVTLFSLWPLLENFQKLFHPRHKLFCLLNNKLKLLSFSPFQVNESGYREETSKPLFIVRHLWLLRYLRTLPIDKNDICSHSLYFCLFYDCFVFFWEIDLFVEVGPHDKVRVFHRELFENCFGEVSDKNWFNIELIRFIASKHSLVALVNDLSWDIDEFFKQFVRVVIFFEDVLTLQSRPFFKFVVKDFVPGFIHSDNVFSSLHKLLQREVAQTYLG